MTKNIWERYLEYLKKWADDHYSTSFRGDRPYSFDEWRERQFAETRKIGGRRKIVFIDSGTIANILVTDLGKRYDTGEGDRRSRYFDVAKDIEDMALMVSVGLIEKKASKDEPDWHYTVVVLDDFGRTQKSIDTNMLSTQELEYVLYFLFEKLEDGEMI